MQHQSGEFSLDARPAVRWWAALRLLFSGLVAFALVSVPLSLVLSHTGSWGAGVAPVLLSVLVGLAGGYRVMTHEARP
jgi:hypothetical protein